MHPVMASDATEPVDKLIAIGTTGNACRKNESGRLKSENRLRPVLERVLTQA